MRVIFLFLLLFGFTLTAQNTERVDLSSPNATLYTHIYFLMPDSYDLEKSAATIRGVPRAEAQIKARKIKEILDGNGLRIDFQKVSADPNYVDSTGIGSRNLEFNKHRYAPFPIRMPEIYLEKVGSRWYFSEETVESVNALYKDTFPLEFAFFQEKFPEFFKYTAFGILIWKPIAVLIVMLLCVLLFYAMEPIIFLLIKLVGYLLSKGKASEHSLTVLREMAKPIALLVIIRFIGRVLPSLQLLEWNAVLIVGIKIAETVFWVYLVLKFVKVLLNVYYEGKQQTKLDRQLAPILGKVIAGVIILIGFLHGITLFGVDPATVLAGASIGGVAVAFAAQDSVKNMIGTIVIFLDKPFQLEDWVVIGSIEGAVEKVGFRSTRLRGADTTLYQIPNSKVVDIEINNKGLRVYRRYTTELGIRYDTPPDLIEDFMEGIKEIIKLHPETRSQSYNVDFVNLGDFALKIMVNVYFQDPTWGVEQSSKNILNLAIVRLAAALNVQFAFPSSTLMIEELPGQESLATQYTLNAAARKKKIAEVLKDFESRDHKYDHETSQLAGI